MENLARSPQSLVVMLGAVAAMIGLLAMTRPGTHTAAKPSPKPQPVDLSSAHRYSTAAVRDAFLGEGLSFRFTKRSAGVTTVSPVPPPWLENDLYVAFAGPKAVVYPAVAAQGVYERRLGNVLVHYGGSDSTVLHRVQVAVAALTRTSR